MILNDTNSYRPLTRALNSYVIWMFIMYVPFHDGSSNGDAIEINDNNDYCVCWPYVRDEMIVSIGPRIYDATVYPDLIPF